jgi:hypothetical protein
MADTWVCRACDTVNNEDRESCMACRADKSRAAPTERPASEAPPEFFPDELFPPPPPPRPDPPRPTVPKPSSPESPPVMERGQRSRRIATGMVLGIGHIGLFIAAFVYLLTEFGVGQGVLRLFYFDIASIAAWQAGPIIHQAILLLDILPFALTKWPYLLLTVACLGMRLARRMPGPLSLAIAIPAALYGMLIALAELPVFIDCLLITLGALAGSCFVVAKTLPEPLA